jgi:hypothetical protein
MATKEHKPMGPEQHKAIRFTDSLVEVAYVCESCGTEINDKREVRPPQLAAYVPRMLAGSNLVSPKQIRPLVNSNPAQGMVRWTAGAE